MMPPTGLAFSLTFCCPLNQFAFPSVSLFWRMYKLARVNNLRADSPLNSASVKWPQLGHRRSNLLLVMRCCLEASLVAANERCKDPVWVGCPCDFEPTLTGTLRMVFPFLPIGRAGHRCLKQKFASLALHGRLLLSAPYICKPLVVNDHNSVGELTLTAGEPV
jgi:hypothetical protein